MKNFSTQNFRATKKANKHAHKVRMRIRLRSKKHQPRIKSKPSMRERIMSETVEGQPLPLVVKKGMWRVFIANVRTQFVLI